MKNKRIVFWLLLVVFAAGSLLWFFTVPYRPADLYRVIPPNAVYVSHHSELAARWGEFSANPLARTLFKSMGLDPDEPALWGDDPDTRMWLDKLLARDLVIAYVPAMGPGREPAWILAGWIGGESIRYRWLLKRGYVSGVEMVQRHAGGSYWLVDTGDEQREELSIAVVEGMVIGAYSADPHAVRYALDIYDGIALGHPLVRDRDWAETLCWPNDPPDRGWFDAPAEDGTIATWFFELDQIDAAGMSGSLCMEVPGDLPPIRTTDIEIPARLFGGVPFIVMGMNPEAGYSLLLPRLPPVGRTIGEGLYESGMNGVFLLAALGGPYAGTFTAISVPSIIGAWPVESEADALARMDALIDRLNAMFRWGLVATETQVANRSVYVVESTADTFYSRMRPRDRIAYTIVDGWMVLATHASPLEKLLFRYGEPAALFEADDGGWQEEVRRSGAAGYGYLNISGGARTLRLAISAYSIKLLFDDPHGSHETRQWLNEVRAWIDTLEPMGAAHFWMDQQEGRLRLRFALGEQGEDHDE